jgi:hypothetical protein
MRPNWIKIVVILVGLWLVVWGATTLVRRRQPTPDRIVAFTGANSLQGKSDAERAKIIEAVASQVNRLEYDQRRELNQQRRLDPFWKSLTSDEQGRYLELVLPTGFKQMMENFNKMEPAKRRRMVQKAVENLRSGEGGGPPRDMDDAQMRKIVEQGMKSFYSDATIEAKMDALPFIEALEQTVKWSH